MGNPLGVVATVKRRTAIGGWLLLAAMLAAPAIARGDAPIEVAGVTLALLDEAQAPARGAGWVASVEAREGDRVEHGATLALLDDEDARLAVAAAEAERAIAAVAAEDNVPARYAAKAAEVAEAELRRSQDSIKRFAGSVSESQLDVERLSVDKAKLEHEKALEMRRKADLELKLATVKLDAARVELARRRIVAPLDGVVVESSVRRGEWLEPGQKAFRLVSIDRLKAEGFLEASRARDLQPGAAVRMSGVADSPRGPIVGRLVFVSPEVDPVTNQVRLWAEVDNSAGTWRPGDRGTLRIVADGDRSVARGASP
jgi:macrolide-specific efflux system membrane fusion protein